MNMTTHVSTRSVNHYRQREQIVFSAIPGMAELNNASCEEEYNQLCALYPDAAFARMISLNLFCPNRDLNAIYLRAYQAILNGEPIAAVHFRFDKELNAHWENHMWDD